MKELRTTLKLKSCYAGLVDVVGGKMWYTYDENADHNEYYTTKREAVAAVRRIYKSNTDMRNAVLNQINRPQGRAYFYH